MTAHYQNKIVIVGATGFVGKSLETAWRESGSKVYSLSRQELDLLDSQSVEDLFLSLDFDVVIHCAAVGGSRLTGYDAERPDVVEHNLRLFFNVARCLRSRQRLIYLGSGAEYDRRHYIPKMSESFYDRHVPADAYGFAKYTISQYIARHDNMLCLRIFGLYGPYEDYRYKFISNAIVKAMLGMPIKIMQNVVFDYLYIKDFVCLIERLLSCDWPYRHMNITPTESSDLLTIAGIVNQTVSNHAEIEVINPGLNTEYTGDNRRLLNVVGDYSFTALSTGIHELTEYYRSVWNSLDLASVQRDPFIERCIIRK